MRMFRSFLLRLGVILTTTIVLCLLLMASTLLIQLEFEAARFIAMLFAVFVVWLIINVFLVHKLDPELSMEVARLAYLSGIFLSNSLSFLMSMYLKELIPGDGGRQHLILPFVGISVSVYLLVRLFDVKWLRSEEEIAFLEDLDKD